MLGTLVWICCLGVVAAQRGGNFLPQHVLGGLGGNQQAPTTPVPILKDSRRIDLQSGAFVYEYIGGDGSSKFEFRYPNGTVVGNYSFVNEQGELETRVYNHGAEVDETTDPNYIDLGNYELYRHLERPYVHNQGDDLLGPQPLRFVPQQVARPQIQQRRRQRQRRPRPQIQIQPQFQPPPQPQPQFNPPPPQPQPQPQFHQPQIPRPNPAPQFHQPQEQFHQPQEQFHQPQEQFHQPQFQPQPQPQFRPQPQIRVPRPQRPQPQRTLAPALQARLPPSQPARPSLIDTPTFQIPQNVQQHQHRLDLSQPTNDPDALLDSVIARFN